MKDHLTKDPDNEFGWHMDVTECYVYLMAHAHKHFALGGTGLRTPLDVYVYLRNHEDELNWERVREGTHEIGIDDFEERMRTFAQRVFAPGKPLALQADDEELFRYLATSGTYGTTVHQVQNKLAKKGRGVPVFRRLLGDIGPLPKGRRSAARPRRGGVPWLRACRRRTCLCVYRTLGHGQNHACAILAQDG